MVVKVTRKFLKFGSDLKEPELSLFVASFSENKHFCCNISFERCQSPTGFTKNPGEFVETIFRPSQYFGSSGEFHMNPSELTCQSDLVLMESPWCFQSKPA